VPRTEGLRSWDIRGSNVRLNRVFELNCLPYGGYPGDDAADRRGKKLVDVTEEGPSQEATPVTKKRKIGTAVGGVGVSISFAVELMGTCAAPGGRMSSSELRESSARMLKVTGGRWSKNVLIPRAAGEDIFTSRMARDLKIFPYGRNVAAVVSAVMEKDRQDAAQKRRAVFRIGDPFREAKRVWGGGGRSLLPPAPPTQHRLRSRPPLGPRSLRQVRRLPLLARANHTRASLSRGEGCPPWCVVMRWGHVSSTSTRTSMCRIILLVSVADFDSNKGALPGADLKIFLSR
jgi:hypothetical protein